VRFCSLDCEVDQCKVVCLVQMSVKEVSDLEDWASRKEVIGVIDRAFHLPS
jgi:hypothetical protein